MAGRPADAVQRPAVRLVSTWARSRLEVLGPRAGFHDTDSDPNNSSLVLRAELDGTRILLPGDAEVEAQQALARRRHRPARGRAQGGAPRLGVLWPEFLAAVHARPR